MGDLTRKETASLLILLCLWLAAFAPICPELVHDWVHDSDNSHAFLVPVVALAFAWRSRYRLRETAAATSGWGVIVLTGSLALYLLSYAGGIAFTARLALVLSLFGLLWFCLGSQVARLLAFPVSFLLFMIPVPYSILSLVSMPLQLLATRVSVALIRACSIPVNREGNLLFFTNTQLEVAEACSGIRSIVALTMLGVIFAHLSGRGWKSSVALVLSAAPIAVVANIVRVSGTGVLAHFYGDAVARGFLHQFSGIAVFLFGLLLMFLFSLAMNRVRQ